MTDRFKLGGAGLAMMMALTSPVSAAQPVSGDTGKDGITWAPASPTIVDPSRNVSLSAWESFKGKYPKPSVDQNLSDPVLNGAIDIHAHFGPDAFERQEDAFQVARRMQQHGMRGMVLKNHWSETAGLAYLARKYAAPGLEIFGGLALNTVEGGVNPMAVRYFAEVEGGFAKIVWMPTHDAEHEVKYVKEIRPYVRVAENGKLLPQVGEVLDLIAHYHLTLATGHVAPDEMLQIVAAAQKRGIDRIIITHPGLGPMFTDPTIAQMKQAVALGGRFEIVSYELLQADNKAILDAIKAIGPANCIISSDSGLLGAPNHTDALVLSARILRKAGFSERDLDLMFKINPAKVLGLAPL